jgi:hypothetical protein
MEEQTSAERLRRAAILKADGQKTAAILSAEGEKRARILQAEGLRQAKVLEAEGERLAIILNAQGEGQKLRIISVGAASLDSKALTVLSLETMKSVGNGQATKIILPFEVSKLMETVSEYLGGGTKTPERSISNREEIETAVGRADDILGPIPTQEELRADFKNIEEAVQKDRLEAAEAIKEMEKKKRAAMIAPDGSA